MSMTVTDAYLLRPGVDPWDLVATIRERATAVMRERLEAQYLRWMEADKRPVIVHSPEYVAEFERIREEQKDGDLDFVPWARMLRKFAHEFDSEKDETIAIRHHAQMKPENELHPGIIGWYVRHKYRDQKPSDRDLFNLDVTMALVKHKGRFYLRGFGDHCALFGNPLDCLKTMPELAEKEYWNGSDSQLEVMTYRQWKRRGKLWGDIYRESWNVTRMDVDLCHRDTFYRICPGRDMMERMQS